MSCRVTVHCDIRNMKLLRETLDEMGYNYTDKENGVTVKSGFRNIEISENGKVVGDSGSRSTIDKINQTYQKNNVRANALKQGHMIESIREVGEDIVLEISY